MKHKQVLILILLVVGLVGAVHAQNNCLSFDGVDDYVGSYGDILDMGTSDWTASAWFKTSPGLVSGGIVGKSSYRTNFGRWTILFEAGVLEVIFQPHVSTTVTHHIGAGGTFNNGVWHNITVVFDRNGYLEVYMNGVFHSRTSIAAHNNVDVQNSDVFMIGRYQNPAGTGPHDTFGKFQGSIDEVRVWNIALTPTQIANNYDREISTPQSGLLAYWKFNEVAPSQTAPDAAGNYNGTLLPAGYANGPQWSAGPDITLPVELSTFTAVMTSEYFVRLYWVTQSETSVSGFYIYRGLDNDLSQALVVSPMIEASNTSGVRHYEYVDHELDGQGTYYYWLVVQDMDGSVNYHGPTTVYFNPGGYQDIPGIPAATAGLQSIYPNPFSSSATISYVLKDAASVDITIYNMRGQIVRTFSDGSKAAGSWKVNWNGMDNNGRSCSTGMYYIKMQAGSNSSILKAVLMN